MGTLGFVLTVSLILVQVGDAVIPAEPVIINTRVGGEGLAIEPTDPKPIVGVFLVICRNRVFMCSDNGAEFKVCARWELSELGVRNPRFVNGKCVADKQ